MIKVIIFDLDGLLIDSQPLQYQAYNQAFSNYGAPLTLEDWHQWVHHGSDAKSWIKKNNLSLDPETIRAQKKEIYDQLIQDQLQLKPGALDLINKLYGKYKLCIASSSRIESVQACVKKFQLESKFEKLISDAEMPTGKPHPYIFLEAAKLMNVNVSECIVIEDSIAGLKAAKSAKMICIICPDSFCSLEPSAYQAADKIVRSLEEISDDTIEKLS